MTVIAYSSKHRVMASDSRCTDGSMHFSSCQKVFRLRNGALFGFSGDVDTRDFRQMLEVATPKRLPSRKKIKALASEISAVIVFRSGEVFTIDGSYDKKTSEWCGEVIQVSDPFVAVGCGAKFAYGAMEVGASPVQAVEATCRRDTACALPVQWEKLEP